MATKQPPGVHDPVPSFDAISEDYARPSSEPAPDIVPGRRTEFVDRLAMMLWVQWDPLLHPFGTERDETLRNGKARECVREAERLWRIRNE